MAVGMKNARRNKLPGKVKMEFLDVEGYLLRGQG